MKEIKGELSILIRKWGSRSIRIEKWILRRKMPNGKNSKNYNTIYAIKLIWFKIAIITC